MACGGSSTTRTCLQLVDGDWSTSHNLMKRRYAPTSWTTTDGNTLLIGGVGEEQTTELVTTYEVRTLTLKYNSS